MKRGFGLLVIAAMMLSTAFAKDKKSFPPSAKTIALTELTQEISSDLLSGKLDDVIFECQAGTQLPLKYLGKFDFFSVQYVPNLTLRVDRKCYLRFMKGKGYISYDLQNWEKISKCRGFQRDPQLKLETIQSHISVETYSEESLNSLEFLD